MIIQRCFQYTICIHERTNDTNNNERSRQHRQHRQKKRVESPGLISTVAGVCWVPLRTYTLLSLSRRLLAQNPLPKIEIQTIESDNNRTKKYSVGLIPFGEFTRPGKQAAGLWFYYVVGNLPTLLSDNVLPLITAVLILYIRTSKTEAKSIRRTLTEKGPIRRVGEGCMTPHHMIKSTPVVVDGRIGDANSLHKIG